MDPVRLEVRSDRTTYTVAIGPRLLARLPALLREAGIGGSPAIVSSRPVWNLHGSRLRPLLGGAQPILIPDGERYKTLATVSRLYDAFAKRRLDRRSVIIAFGGGVVGDVAGFAAATYLRGLPLVQIPTTLLSQVDSAIGGKTGVNLAEAKNLIGAFHAPAFVACDPDVLVSLPRREFRSGLVEVIKYGVIASRPLFERVAASLDNAFAHDRAVLVPVIAECCRIKADVVSRDERESGPRRVLNFGHTLGHALEAVTSYRRFRHGEAIAYGIRAAAHLSAARGLLHEPALREITTVLDALGPMPAVADLSVSRVVGATALDKKVANGRLHFVLTTGIGTTQIVDDVRPEEMANALGAIGLRKP